METIDSSSSILEIYDLKGKRIYNFLPDVSSTTAANIVKHVMW